VFGLDVMRATAIVLVLVNHGGIWFSNYPAVYATICLTGYFGVELFFVLSGFLIGGILFRWLSDPESPLTLLGFWRRRWMRTLPNYFLFLLINGVLAAALYHQNPPIVRYALFVQNVAAPPSDFFGESWSLAIEEWFYFIVPICFVAALRLSKWSLRANSFVIICVIILVVTIARSIYVVSAQPMWLGGVREIVVYRLDACMYGVLAAWIKQFYLESWQRPSPRLFVYGVAALLVIVPLALMLPPDSLFLHTAGFPITSIGAALLLPTLDAWKTSVMPGRTIVTRISVWSYSLYFVNVVVFALIFQWWRHLGPVFCSIAFVVLSVLVAAVVYRFYEKPIMNLRDRRRPSRMSTLVTLPTRAPDFSRSG
jgi:peptidoglycan/LPS O-acetylase OafA/YrhL